MTERNADIAQAPKLLDQVRLRLRTMHYSLRTEETYLHWIRRFILFHGKRQPRAMVRRSAIGAGSTYSQLQLPLPFGRRFDGSITFHVDDLGCCGNIW